jgi:hypothetical protein
MPDLDKRASVVDKFFGDDDEDSPASGVKHAAIIQQRSQSRKDKRTGVGTVATSGSKVVQRADLNNKILQIGKKRRLQQQAEELDSSIGVDVDAGDEEDEELGRTAIAEKPSKGGINDLKSLTASQPQPKKKKLGKKERQSTSNNPDGEKDNGGSTDGKLIIEIDRKGVDLDSLVVNEPAPKEKRKRKKVRSRQKNIYKDKREIKPDHLIPGNKHYKGKPITPETRKKLNLPDPTIERKETVDWQESVDAVPLAGEQKIEQPKSDSKAKRSKGKKSKYKNLNYEAVIINTIN